MAAAIFDSVIVKNLMNVFQKVNVVNVAKLRQVKPGIYIISAIGILSLLAFGLYISVGVRTCMVPPILQVFFEQEELKPDNAISEGKAPKGFKGPCNEDTQWKNLGSQYYPRYAKVENCKSRSVLGLSLCKTVSNQIPVFRNKACSFWRRLFLAEDNWNVEFVNSTECQESKLLYIT